MWARVCLLFALTCTLSAQTLARPGLAGSGLDKNPWWQRAIFYQVDSPAESTDFKAIAARLDALRALGVDALLLPAPALPPNGGALPPSIEDLDTLLRQSSAHSIRVLLTLPPSSSAADLSGVARFWLSRGVAGLHIATPPGTSPEAAQTMTEAVRKLAAGTVGQRIILSDVDLALPGANQAPSHRPSPRAAARTSGAQLQIDSRLNSLPTIDAATLRGFLVQTLAQPNLLLDVRPPNSAASLAHVVATVALLTLPSSLINSDAHLTIEPAPDLSPVSEESEPAAKPTPPPQPPPGTYLPYVPYVPPSRPKPKAAPKPVPPDPLTVWYQQLMALHHGNAVVRNGAKTFLDFDAQNALVWVDRPATSSPQTPPVVVICNLSASPTQLSLTDAMNHLNLHGWFLRPLLRSYEAMGAQPLDSISVPPFGVYIGELRR